MAQQGDVAQVHAAIDARRVALRQGDAVAVVAPLAPDAIVYDLQPPLAFAGDAARDIAGLTEWLATWQEPPSVELGDPQVEIGGDLAVACGLSHLTGVKVDDGPVDLWFRTTLVFRRDDGRWRIVHEHNSVPFLMDGSFKAAIDLKP